MTGREFVEDVRAALRLADTLSQEEYQEERWCGLDGGAYISTRHSSIFIIVILGVSPQEARQWRDGREGAGAQMFFALLRDGSFAVLLERNRAIPGLTMVKNFDFVGGHRTVYES